MLMQFDQRNKSVYDIMKRAQSVLLVSHRGPDGDTIGATSALRRWCEREGIAVVNFCTDPLPQKYLFLAGTEKYVSDPAVFDDGKHDVVVVCDCGDSRFAGIDSHIDSLKKRATVINFDHHPTNEGYGHLNIIDAAASSTCELVYRFFVDNQVEICRDMATSLLTGLLTDTGNFSNPATTRDAIEAASGLLKSGARMHDVGRNLFRNKSVGSLRLWGAVLARLKYDEKLGVASTVILADDLNEETTDEHVEGVSNFLNTFLDADVIMVLREMPDGQVRGSLRSVEGVDVSRVAKLMGGGGHCKAAGFSMAGRIVEETDVWRVERT